MNPKYKLGRKPRKFDPRVKTFSALAKHQTLPAAPLSVDWTDGKTDFGMMLNDQLGDCTCAAVFHARQIWTMNAAAESTEPDPEVLDLYEAACGYNPADPNTDGGGILQDVLSYLMNTGMPLSDGTFDKLLGYVEVDQTKLNEVKLTVSEFGVGYIGIDLPQSVWGSDGNPLPVWDYAVGSPAAGGHCVVIVGYDGSGLKVISWGSLYTMTWSFFSKYCDEIYAPVDCNWIKQTGKTPMGLDLTDLETLMSELKD